VKETEIAAMIHAPHFFCYSGSNEHLKVRSKKVFCFLCTCSMILALCVLVLVSRSLSSKETAEGKEFYSDRQRAKYFIWCRTRVGEGNRKTGLFMEPMGRLKHAFKVP
jgi:hypothetical protein